MAYVASTDSVVVFRNAEHLEAARQFLRYLARPQTLGSYVEAALGRFYPVMPASAETPFWTDPTDPHRRALKHQFTERPTQPLPVVYDYRYSQVVAEAVWPKAIGRIVIDGWTPEAAADEAIARTKLLMEQ